MSERVPSSGSDNAVHHFTNWTGWNWGLWTLVLVGALVFAIIAVGAVRAWDDLEGGALWIAGGCAVAALVLYPLSLYQLVRHFSNYKSGIALLLVVTFAVVAILLLGLDTGVAFRAFAVAAVVYGVGLFVYDGLSRVASGIPTSVLGLLGLIVVGTAVMTAYATERR